MPEISLTRHVDAPIEEVFARFTDFARAPEMVSGITAVEMLTDGPVDEGTRFEETRVMFGREATEEMEVTHFDPPHAYTLGADSHGSRYRSTFHFAEKDGGTEVKLDFVATPLTLVAKVMSVLTRPMIKTVIKECAKDLDDLKAYVETGKPAPSA